ncbi:MAG: SH3 domain-containing C40 family peptidase [Oscillospiraceae bacterium]
MNTKILKTIIISAALSCVLAASAFASSIGGATVKATSLNLRSQPSTDAKSITMVPQGAAVVVGQRVNDDWYKVVYRGALGYMSSEFISFSEVLDGAFGSGTVRGSSVRVRTAPTLTSSILGTFNNGTKMQLLGVAGNWYKVSINGGIGYIHSDYFALNGGVSDFSEQTDSDNSSAGQAIVDTAMKYMGVPYVWGGTSSSGFDCSGLVYYVFKECGYTTNRTAASIYKNGVYVDKANLQVGDAVCFSSPSSGSIGHVGIYIGNDQFIHASSSSRAVIVTDLNSDYYVQNYVGARRIV